MPWLDFRGFPGATKIGDSGPARQTPPGKVDLPYSMQRAPGTLVSSGPAQQTLFAVGSHHRGARGTARPRRTCGILRRSDAEAGYQLGHMPIWGCRCWRPTSLMRMPFSPKLMQAKFWRPTLLSVRSTVLLRMFSLVVTLMMTMS